MARRSGDDSGLIAESLQPHVQGVLDCFAADVVAAEIGELPFLGEHRLAGARQSEPDQPDGLFGRTAVRPGDARDGEHDAGARILQGAGSHLVSRFGGNGAVLLERFLGHAEHLDLRFV